MSAMTRRPSTGLDGTRGLGGLRPLETETESSATTAIDGPLEAHRATVGFGDVLHDRESEARSRKVARVVRSPEPVEDTGRVLSSNTRTVVAHRDLTVCDSDVDRRAGR